ncbi:MAG: hypothetical protein COV74_03325 [Candidatus Omnitrophica bacterium CG11_big_fil_rev_8_21_14_0_20_45_26]|uniref:General secretion pathway protein F n=1 Tax=Candidatus Abzuiibacterium crystallinum TaxID=1974748 RepID=A0A2H0LR87_9BACT|nr:MAG: hypothetical protein COV74_03325 [Candidatus Omnitrophica bacterium CG11_big_fil_rev_8_21_14_0_20_45_26]PIW64706.1 MAG: hypothetical protein COW12_05350 [Candidatus Omnitrophica bacterium CG12_big_fil_rev_8_21_14_0_65_45_16]
MKLYKYRAKKGIAEVVEGTLGGETRDEIIDKLNVMGLLPIDIEEEKKRIQPIKARDVKVFFRKIKTRDISVFYRQLAKLVKSGIPILKSLSIIHDQTNHVYLKGVTKQLIESVKDGNSLSTAMAEHPKAFTSFDIAMLQTGENIGKIEESLKRLIQYHQEKENIQSKVRTALAYPVFVCCMGIFTIFIMLTFVIPKFSTFFANMGQKLPTATRILMGVSQWCQFGWFWILLLALGIFLLIQRMKQYPREKRILDKIIFFIPQVKMLIIKSEVATISRALALQIENGVLLINALKTACPVIGNLLLREEFERCLNTIQEGGSFSEGLNQTKYVPSFFKQLIKVGEETGNLDETLKEIADWYEQDVFDYIRIFTNLLEPILILIVGFILGLIIIAVLLPVFSFDTLVT